MTDQRLFQLFLMRNKAWSKWKHNVQMHYNTPANLFLLNTNVKEWIIAAFILYSTNEGGKYWLNLNKKWINYIYTKLS